MEAETLGFRAQRNYWVTKITYYKRNKKASADYCNNGRIKVE